MANQNIRLFNRMEIDASKYGTSATTAWQALMKNIPAGQAREALMAIRVHAIKAAIGTSTTITIGVFGSAPTEEDPTQEYWTANSLGVLTPLFSVQLTATLPTPAQFSPCVLTGSNGTLSGSTPNGGFFALPAFLTVAMQIVGGSPPMGDVFVSGDLVLRG